MRSNPNSACSEPSSLSCWKDRVLVLEQRGQGIHHASQKILTRRILKEE